MNQMTWAKIVLMTQQWMWLAGTVLRYIISSMAVTRRLAVQKQFIWCHLVSSTVKTFTLYLSMCNHHFWNTVLPTTSLLLIMFNLRLLGEHLLWKTTVWWHLGRSTKTVFSSAAICVQGTATIIRSRSSKICPENCWMPPTKVKPTNYWGSMILVSQDTKAEICYLFPISSQQFSNRYLMFFKMVLKRGSTDVTDVLCRSREYPEC